MNCKYCNKYFKYIGSHERCCKNNIDRDLFLDKLKRSSEIAAENKKKEWLSVFEKIKLIIKSRNGKLLSENYNGYNSKIRVECEQGHTWDVIPYTIIRGKWCKKCADTSLILSIDDFKKRAIERGGECLSTNYSYNNEKLEWKCFFGHVWQTKPSIITSGSWCPVCSSGLYERICRLYMETIFNNKFLKTRPGWLIGKNNTRLELDGYCEELNLAFEHNGYHHYSDKKEDLILQKNDKIKIDLCKKQGVRLIIIPELFNKLKFKDLKQEIKKQSLEMGVLLPLNFDNIEVDLKKAYATNSDLIKINEIKNALLTKNMILVEEYYPGILGYIDIKCNNCGNIYNKKINNILNNNSITDCEVCSYRGVLLSDIKFIIKNNGGLLISNINSLKVAKQSSVKCKCNNGHIFNKKVRNILNGSWCMTCYRINNPVRPRKSLNERKSFASLYNAKCLDFEDLKDSDKSIWECKHNHIFEASFKNMRKRKSFCIICNN